MEHDQIDPAAFSAAVARVIEALRWEKRFSSARKLAMAAGMTHTYIYPRLSGEQSIDMTDLATFARVFEVSPDDIIDRALHEMSDETPNLGAVASTETRVEDAGEDSI